MNLSGEDGTGGLCKMNCYELLVSQKCHVIHVHWCSNPMQGQGYKSPEWSLHKFTLPFSTWRHVVLRLCKSGGRFGFVESFPQLLWFLSIPPVRRFSATKLDHSVIFLVWVRFFWRSCTQKQSTNRSSVYIYSIKFFRTFQSHIIFWTHL